MTERVRKPGRPKDESLVARRCEEILGVAMRVFAEQGYRQTDVQMIADILKIGKGTIYRYFPTKETLFLAAVDQGMRQLTERINCAVVQTAAPLEQVRTAVRVYLAFFDEHPQLVELLIQERAEFKERKQPTYFAYQEANIGHWRQLFQQLIKEGRVRSIPVERILDVLSNLLYGAIFTNHFAGRRKPFEIQAKDVLDVAFYGILSQSKRDNATNSCK